MWSLWLLEVKNTLKKIQARESECTHWIRTEISFFPSNSFGFGEPQDLSPGLTGPHFSSIMSKLKPLDDFYSLPFLVYRQAKSQRLNVDDLILTTKMQLKFRRLTKILGELGRFEAYKAVTQIALCGARQMNVGHILYGKSTVFHWLQDFAGSASLRNIFDNDCIKRLLSQVSWVDVRSLGLAIRLQIFLKTSHHGSAQSKNLNY